MRFSVDGELLQKIINYMGNRPYAEVAAILDKLQQDAVLDEASKEEVVNESKEA